MMMKVLILLLFINNNKEYLNKKFHILLGVINKTKKKTKKYKYVLNLFFFYNDLIY